MKIFDGHFHARMTEANPKDLLQKMEKAGVYGGCVFSNKPYIPGQPYKTVYSFQQRMDEVLSWTKDYPDRLFPVIWVHPDEENLIENLSLAKENGICAFKMCANDYYVYEEKAIKVLKEMARIDMPVFFHSGILWSDGTPESKYNKPLNWEALIEIEGLRFSMGHCSWPWVDECIAMYGEFLNGLISKNTAEMYFDITPGTPKIYREELLTKLYTVGYDVGNNIFFGTDANAFDYNSEWAADWLETDRKIMDKLGVSKENRQKLYHDNLLRFLGKTPVKIEHLSPECDNSNSWRCDNPKVKDVIRKRYESIGFDPSYNEAFSEALETIKISDAITIEDYDVNEKDGKRNLLSYLFMLDALEKKYEEKGIPKEIFEDTIKDLSRWTDTWTDVKNELYLGELSWLKHHYEMKLFKIGRLQFCMGECEHDIPSKGLKVGDPVMEIHIPEAGPLDKEACEASIEQAKAFFSKYFPEFEYKYFTCHSWLLDQTLSEILSENSNILKFQELFEIVDRDEADSLLGYIFKWKINRRQALGCVCNSGFAQRVKDRILKNGKFYNGLGVIEK